MKRKVREVEWIYDVRKKRNEDEIKMMKREKKMIWNFGIKKNYHSLLVEIFEVIGRKIFWIKTFCEAKVIKKKINGTNFYFKMSFFISLFSLLFFFVFSVYELVFVKIEFTNLTL